MTGRARANRPVDLNSRRRCRRCRALLVKREIAGPVWTVNWTDAAATDTTSLPNGMVVWGCPLCDFKAGRQ